MRRYLWIISLIAIILCPGKQYPGKMLLLTLNDSVQAQASTEPEPPRVWLNTAYTPPAGNTINVQAGGNLQAALDQAQPGDQIVLQAGASFTGNFVLPAKTGSNWIVLRSSNMAGIPQENERVVPGVHASAMPKILSPNNSGAITTAAQSHHYRFIGIEFGLASSVAANTGIIRLGDPYETHLNNVSHDLIIDRCYIHGNPLVNARRGVALNSASTAIVDSYISEIHEVGADSQAVCGWNGPGPYKIVNNHLEASGENVMFGGADPAIYGLIPSDIEFRRNHCFKPLSWKQGQPGFAGTAWSVKNLCELKNAQRIVLEGNLFENNWMESQTGYAILIKSVNQDGTAPWCTTQDVDFKNNIVRHTGSAVNILGRAQDQLGGQTKRVRIKNNLFEDVSSTPWNGAGAFLQISDTPDVTVDHNTAMQTGNIIVAYGPASPGFVFINNVMPHNTYGVKGDGTGVGTPTIDQYFPASVFRRNAMVGGQGFPYPADNLFFATLGEIGFVDRANGNYRLTPNSPCRNAGTDGQDLGADIDAIEAAMSENGPPSGNLPPQVSASASQTSGAAPLGVSFTGVGQDPDGWIAQYDWDFGDGQTSNIASPMHVYQTPANYTAQLTVRDNLGATASATVGLTVNGNGTITAENVVWTNSVGCAVTGNSLRKTSSEGWGNSGASSSQRILSGDGYMEFTASETTLERVCGLTGNDSNQYYNTIAYAVQLSTGRAFYVFEMGASRGYFGDYNSGDVFRIAIESGVVRYYRNGAVFYTSAVAPAYPMMADASLGGTNSTISNAKIAFISEEPDPTAPPVVRVLTPNTNENISAGATYSITWTVTGPKLRRNTIELSLDGGSSWSLVAKTSGAATSYNWRVPRRPSSRARIRVTALAANGSTGEDQSDTTFVIR